VSKHRFFIFLPTTILADDGLIAIGVEDAFHLGVLSSVVHSSWSLATGSTLEDRPRYNSTTCFETFPFPITEGGKDQTITTQLRDLAEQLDAHRKRQQAAHPTLTLTGMYNVLEKLRSGEALTAKERTIHEQGLVSVLRQIHDELDAAVLAAYGWSDLLPGLRIAHGLDAPAAGQSREEAKCAFDAAMLERLVALNAERAAEEARGLVRWLRPEFQAPGATAATTPAPQQGELAADAEADESDAPSATPPPAKKLPWPADNVAQVRVVAELLAANPTPMAVDDIAVRFSGRGPWKRRLPQLLEILVALGRARAHDGRYGAI